MNTGRIFTLGTFSALQLGALILLLAGLSVTTAQAAEPTLSDKAQEVVRDTSSAVKDAGRTAAEGAKSLWQQIDAARLGNRTPDQIVAWILVGLLVGSAAGMLTTLKPTGLGKLGRLLLGLAGAFLGGIAVQFWKFDFGWGPVLIRYEELFFSLVGAVLIVIIGKLIRNRSKKNTPAS